MKCTDTDTGGLPSRCSAPDGAGHGPLPLRRSDGVSMIRPPLAPPVAAGRAGRRWVRARGASSSGCRLKCYGLRG